MNKKVVVVGTGMVGASYAYSLINQNICNELVLVDLNKESAEANAQDLIHSTCFLDNQPKIYSGEYKDCKDADVVCITAGAAQKPGQTRLDLVEINKKIMTGIVTDVMSSGFDGILLIASNPVDIMTLVAQEVSKLPKERVFGSGTTLDTARFRNNLAQYFDVNPTDVNAYIIGEHGDSSLPVWSTATIGQKSIAEYLEENPSKYNQAGLDKCFTDARDAAYEIIKGKGATYFGIGIALARITKAIFCDQKVLLTVGVYQDGKYGIDGIYLPVPARVGKDGIVEVQKLNISAKEQEQLEASATQLQGIINNI